MEKKDPTLTLAFRIYPEPKGTTYDDKDLSNEQKVIELFDYCQILEAIIYKEGWHFLIKHFGIKKLFDLNQKSGWLDAETLEEYKKELEYQISNALNS